MHAERFRHLLDHDGPFASIYFDDSHDTEDAAAQQDLRWRAILGQLDEQGVDPNVCAQLEHAVLDGSPPVGRSGRALVAGGDGVIIDEPLLRAPATPVVRVSTLPYLIPVVEHGVQQPVYLVVAIDHTGADITVHRHGHSHGESVDGGGHPVHEAAGAETAGYGNPQRRTDEAAKINVRAVAAEITTLVDQLNVDTVFVVGEVRSRKDLEALVPKRVADLLVALQDGARTSIDEQQLRRDVAEHFEMRRLAVMDEAAQQFVRALDGDTGLATQGLTAVCAALRDGAVETLIIGDVGDRTVVLGDTLAVIAADADELSVLGAAPTAVVRADEALPLLAVSTDSALIRTDERIEPTDGIAAVLRYAPPS